MGQAHFGPLKLASVQFVIHWRAVLRNPWTSTLRLRDMSLSSGNKWEYNTCV